MQTVGALVRKQETEYRRGSVNMSKYVTFDMHDTIEKIDAYLNSKHVSGETDSLGREKPFFNICIASSNIWYHATDIDRKNINLRATNSKSWLNSYLYTIHLRQWMREENFGATLNNWGRTLSRYGSAALKIVENDTGLHITVVPWQRLICDAVEFGPNPKIEVLELTPGQLQQRVKTMHYDQNAVDQLITAHQETRETLDHLRKDNRPGYIKLYEVHGLFSRANLLQGKGVAEDGITESDQHIYLQQMQVIAYIGKKTNGGRTSTKDFQDFVVFAGEEEQDPYMLTHLIEEDGRTLARGAVENLFQAQWMVNHSQKMIKDALDLSSKLVFQTADPFFVGQNVLDNIETGDILIHAMNMPLTKVDTSKMDIGAHESFAVQWKGNGNEINSISDAMLGHMPMNSRGIGQMKALLQESYSVFEIMLENKGFYLGQIIRNHWMPFAKRTYLNHSKEIAAVLDDHDVEKIDSVYLKNAAIKLTNSHVLHAINANLDRIAQGQPVQPIDAGSMLDQNMAGLQQSMALSGNTRYFKPSDLSDATWAEQFKDTDVDIEVDVTGEEFDSKEIIANLNMALQTIMTPGFEQNAAAKAVVGRILETSGTMSPIEYSSLPSSQAPTPAPNSASPGAAPSPSPSPVPTPVG